MPSTPSAPRRIRAAVLREPGRPLAIEELDLGAPREGEVEVRIAASGVCGSDLHQILGEYRLPLPCVPGHEGAGVVERIGPGVSGIVPGDHVVLLWRSPCGHCSYCLAGRPALCPHAAEVRRHGAMPDGTSRLRAGGQTVHHFLGVSCWAEYAVVPAAAVVRVPAELPLEYAALVGCAVVTGIGAAWNAAALRPGQSVVVFGCGGVGLNILQGAALAGAHPIVAVDSQADKEALTTIFGATHFVDGRRADVVEAVRALTDGGADAAFEAVGLPALMETALAATRPGGQVVLVGVAPEEALARFNPQALVQHEKTIRGCIYGSAQPARDIPRLLQLFAAGRLRLGELVGRRRPLAEINRAIADMRTGTVARVVVDMQA